MSTHSGPMEGAETSSGPCGLGQSPAPDHPWLTRARPEDTPYSHIPDCSALKPDWSLGVPEDVGVWALSCPLSLPADFGVRVGEHLQTLLSTSFSESPSGCDGLRVVSAGLRLAYTHGHRLPSTPSRDGARTTKRTLGRGAEKRGGIPSSSLPPFS